MLVPTDTTDFDNLYQRVADIEFDSDVLTVAHTLLLRVFSYKTEAFSKSISVKRRGSAVIVEWNEMDSYITLELSRSGISVHATVNGEYTTDFHTVPEKIAPLMVSLLTTMYEVDNG